MPDDIAHKDIEDVIIDRNHFSKARHGSKLAAIPINGQHFLRTDSLRGWTVPLEPK